MKDINIKIYYAKETKILRKKLKDGSFFKDNNKFYVDDLFSDTNLARYPSYFSDNNQPIGSLELDSSFGSFMLVEYSFANINE